MKLQLAHDFNEIGAEKSSLIKSGELAIQFLWHQNLLEECEDFSFKHSNLKEDELAEATSLVTESLKQGGGVANIFTALIQNQNVGYRINFAAKFALDQHFNYEVQSFQSNLICRCFGISKQMLIDDLNKAKTSRIEDWKSNHMVGMGCGTCLALAEEFFRSEFDNPSSPSKEFLDLRKQKVIEDQFLIKPLGKTPIELIEFLEENMPNTNVQIQRVSGYQVYVDGVSASELGDLKNHFLENYEVLLDFELA